MRLMNFGFSVEKDGNLRALPPQAGDVLALLEAMGILGKRWRSLVGFISEDRLERVDSLYKVYYPIYLVREGKYVIPIDGMGVHGVRIGEVIELHEEYGVLSSKIYNLPLIGNEKLLRWMGSTVEEKIQDGYAAPHILTREEAISIAKEVVRIYESLEEYLDNVRSSLESQGLKLKEDLKKIQEECMRINKEYEKKITDKNIQIEGLLTASENEELKKIREEFHKHKDSLKNERKSLENLVKNLMDELNEVDSKMEKIKKEVNEIREKIARIEAKKEKLSIEKKRVEEGSEKFDKIRSIIKDLEDCERSIEVNKKNESTYKETLLQLQEQRERILKRVEEVQNKISRLKEEERIVPSKEDLELRKVRRELVIKRGVMINELNSLLAEREKALCNLRAREDRLKFEYKKFKDLSESTIKSLESELKVLKNYIWKGVELSNDVELLYIPYFVTYKNDKLYLIEPPIVLKGFKKAEEFKDVGINREITEAVFGSWEVLSVILFEAREVFDILSKRNRNRILEGISILKEVGGINSLQEAILLKQIA
ncbi:MAG: hypothetical protein QXU75_01490 [Candidatus Methanomethylicaceae archaeon]